MAVASCQQGSGRVLSAGVWQGLVCRGLEACIRLGGERVNVRHLPPRHKVRDVTTVSETWKKMHAILQQDQEMTNNLDDV